jgi:hypothetical protein
VNDVAPRFYPGFTCDYSHFRKPMQPLAPDWLSRLFYRSQFLVTAGYKMGRLGPITLQSQVQYPMPPIDVAAHQFRENGVECFRGNLSEAVGLAKSAGAQVCVLTQSYLDSPAFQGPTDELKRLDALYKEGLAQHNEVVRAVAYEMQVPCIQLDQTMPMETRYFADPVHMTEMGNIVKARLVAETLQDSFRAP